MGKVVKDFPLFGWGLGRVKVLQGYPFSTQRGAWAIEFQGDDDADSVSVSGMWLPCRGV